MPGKFAPPKLSILLSSFLGSNNYGSSQQQHLQNAERNNRTRSADSSTEKGASASRSASFQFGIFAATPANQLTNYQKTFDKTFSPLFWSHYMCLQLAPTTNFAIMRLVPSYRPYRIAGRMHYDCQRNRKDPKLEPQSLVLRSATTSSLKECRKMRFLGTLRLQNRSATSPHRFRVLLQTLDTKTFDSTTEPHPQTAKSPSKNSAHFSLGPL